jgi:hypothetical protein
VVLSDSIKRACHGNLERLTQGDIRTKVWDNLTAIIWEDKRHANMLTNMHHPPEEGNFCDGHGNSSKPAITQYYNQHMGYVDKDDCMTNTYSISRWTWNWTKKLFFHLLDLTVLNIILHSCSSKLSHRDLQLSLIRTSYRRVERCLVLRYHRECQTLSTSQPRSFKRHFA